DPAGVAGPACQPARRHPQHQGTRRGPRFYSQDQASEGYRYGPPGLDPGASPPPRRYLLRPPAALLQAGFAEDGAPPGDPLGPFREGGGRRAEGGPRP